MKEAKTFTRQQQPGEVWSFSCGHFGLLPNSIGESNDFALWKSMQRLSRTGVWACKVCKNAQARKLRKGLGKTGDLGRIKTRLAQGRTVAKINGYQPPLGTPEETLLIWNDQGSKCAGCKSPMTLEQSHLDHNHKTGEVRGFLCFNCNLAEGVLKDYTNEQFEAFCKYRQSLQK